MWQIIGAGAIGCLWAANLKINGQNVHLVTHSRSPSNTLEYQDIQNQHYQFELTCSQKLLDSEAPILLCVKAPQVKEALKNQLHLIGSNQIIILMHNGMGCAEQVQTLLPKNPIICATTANASLLHKPLNIQQTGLGPTYLGAFNQQAQKHETIVTNLNRALTNTSWENNIKQKLWLKLIINNCINPLTALNQIKNGELQDIDLQNQVTRINKECVQVAKKEQVDFDEQEILTIINQVIIATANNYSSMNRDIFFKRKTENDYISGYVKHKAQQHNINVPHIESVYQRVRSLEQSYC